MEKIRVQIKPVCFIWVSWYKKKSGIPTDLTETYIRDYSIRLQLVDIKICSVNEEWSGLKFVIPVLKRNIQATKGI